MPNEQMVGTDGDHRNDLNDLCAKGEDAKFAPLLAAFRAPRILGVLAQNAQM